MARPIPDQLLPHIASNAFAQDILASIDEQGYVVLPSVLTQAEADVEYRRMWDWVQTVSPGIRRHSPASWRRRGSHSDPWPCSQRDMMQLHQAGWVFSDLREVMAERVFEQLYGTRELHCSKDGFTLQRPTERELSLSPNDHYDQGGHHTGLQCIQGSVALTDQEYEDGCFLCWPGSHKYHSQIMHSRGGSRGSRKDWVIVNDAEKELLESEGIKPVRVPVRRGDVILWRSDLVHKGAPPLGKRDNFRGVVYICMLPAIMTHESVYRQKQLAYEQLETGSHWPCREEWFTIKKELHIDVQPYFTKLPQLTPRQEQLYGLVRYVPFVPEGPRVLVIMTRERAYDGAANGRGSSNNSIHEEIAPVSSKAKRWGAARKSQNSSTDVSSASSHTAIHRAIPSEPCKATEAKPQAQEESNSTVQKDVRRLQKALREIGNLEERRDKGERLLANQIEKIGRKIQYLQMLQMIDSANIASRQS